MKIRLKPEDSDRVKTLTNLQVRVAIHLDGEGEWANGRSVIGDNFFLQLDSLSKSKLE